MNTVLLSPPPISPALDLFAEIERLKRELNAVILAHYYQESEIQDVADFVGDSLALAQAAAKTEGRRHRLLRRPLHGRDRQDPEPGEAGPAARPRTPAARSPTAARRRVRRVACSTHPDHFVVSYVNCSAGGEGAERRHLHVQPTPSRSSAQVPEDQPILFAPDQHLGRWLDQEDRPRHGALAGHLHGPRDLLASRSSSSSRSQHPERRGDRAPGVRGAGAAPRRLHRLDHRAPRVRASRARRKTFIVVTEPGIIHQMQKAAPGQDVHPGAARRRLRVQRVPAHEAEHAREALPLHARPAARRSTVPERSRRRALVPLERMLEISKGAVKTPD